MRKLIFLLPILLAGQTTLPTLPETLTLTAPKVACTIEVLRNQTIKITCNNGSSARGLKKNTGFFSEDVMVLLKDNGGKTELQASTIDATGANKMIHNGFLPDVTKEPRYTIIVE